MYRERFISKLNDIKHNILKMGAFVEKIIDMAVVSLEKQDIEMAKEVEHFDDKIDDLELEIEEDCMGLLALESPLAKDLRVVATALKIITDLERIGDNAVNISRITIEIGNEPLIKPLIDIPKMAEISQKMVKLSLDAFVNEDIKLAEEVAKMDEEVDRLYQMVIDEVLRLIKIKKDDIFVNQGTKLMFVGRYLERIADHSTNVCERIIYMVTGEYKEIN